MAAFTGRSAVLKAMTLKWVGVAPGTRIATCSAASGSVEAPAHRVRPARSSCASGRRRPGACAAGVPRGSPPGRSTSGPRSCMYMRWLARADLVAVERPPGSACRRWPARRGSGRSSRRRRRRPPSARRPAPQAVALAQRVQQVLVELGDRPRCRPWRRRPGSAPGISRRRSSDRRPRAAAWPACWPAGRPWSASVRQLISSGKVQSPSASCLGVGQDAVGQADHVLARGRVGVEVGPSARPGAVTRTDWSFCHSHGPSR